MIADISDRRTIDFGNRKASTFSRRKGPGSVKAGITWLQGYSIRIHPNCSLLIDEARNYKWQTNKLTGARLGAPVDAFNHSWDATRYATEDCQLGQGDDLDGDTGSDAGSYRGAWVWVVRTRSAATGTEGDARATRQNVQSERP